MSAHRGTKNVSAAAEPDTMEESVFMRSCRSRQTCGRRSTAGENADVLEEIALTHGMKTLRMSAIDYALRGNHHRRGSAACGIR